MAKNPPPSSAPVTIHEVAFKASLEERYLAYALSTITARSLPDVRDGLKPVHRRLLFAMLQLRLDPRSGFKKCARVVGDVIGKYHPHGDTAVYDAMVRLAQSFAVRYPLVNGQGNFGSIDGDNAAAMRYTEAKLTEVAMALLEGIDENTVNFRPTYDGEDAEPVVLPAAFPNLLANGAEGIAVGMATSIPPHNVGEICDALSYLIKHPNAKTERLMDFVQGPDFPTGGLLVEPRETIIQAYDTGRGSLRTRAVWEVEKLSHGMYQVIITQIPYQVQKSKLIEKIADLFKNKKLPLLGNIRDESAEEIRVVLEPRSKQVDPETLMESLFKATDLETRFNLNMNVLTAEGVPQVMGIKGILAAFLAHRHEVLVRRTNYRLEKIAHRLEVLGGLLICYLNLDEVIRIIREEEDPKAELMKVFNLTEVQVEAILNMRLRSLRKLEEMEIRREHKELSQEQKELKALLKDEDLRWQTINGEIKEIKKRFDQNTELGARRTQFGEAPTGKVIDMEAFIEKEPLTVILSRMGWVRALKGHGLALDGIKFKEGDEGMFAVETYTTDKLILFASNGRFYTLTGDKLPRGKGDGEPIRLMLEMDTNDTVVNIFIQPAGAKLLVASDIGKGFIVEADEVVASTRGGKQILALPEGARAVACHIINESDNAVAVIGENRKMLIFPLNQLPPMKKGQGVTLQKYKDKNGKLADVKLFNLKEGLSWNLGGRTRTETDLTAWVGNRADAGRLPPTGFPKSNKFE